MSVGPLSGLIGSVAGAPLAQTKGSELERAGQESANQMRKAEGARRAETAAGIGAADTEDKAPADRDADGRRLWEAPAPGDPPADEDPAPRASRDASGQTGNELDLRG